MNKINAFILLIIIGLLSCSNDNSRLNPEKQILRKWELKSSLQTNFNGQEISSSDFSEKEWLEVEVPTTVLRALVKAKIYPDPHFDLNNFKIPDASDDMNKRLNLSKYSYIKGISNPFKSPYWFRTTFTIPTAQKGKKVWLNFNGINYRADVWVNGNKIADSSTMSGMFRRFKYNISDYIYYNKPNAIAVKIYQVDHPGSAVPGKQLTVFGHHRGWGVDIFKDVTLKFSAGWDCAPVVRDRNMGLYQDVFLSYTGAVDIIDPYVVTKLPLHDTTKANLSIFAELLNTGNKTQKGILKGSIDLIKEVDFYTYKKKMPGNLKTIHFQKSIEIPPGKTINVKFSPNDFPQLTIKNPYLWWPNNYGKQYLHKLKLSYIINGLSSDVEVIPFGIREIRDSIKELDGEYGRVVIVNGKKIFSKGGWLQPDMMLDMNEKRMYDETRLLANANVNMVGSEDMPSPPDYLMDIYDKYGLLVWETFYQCWRMYPGTESFKNPIDADLALKNSYDIVKRYRRHPSLVFWAVANEVTVRKEIYNPLRKYVKSMDSTRAFLPTSSYDWNVDKFTPYIKTDLPLGMTDDGAPDYTWYPHPYYYNKVRAVRQQMFRNEMGVPSVPVFSSMKKFVFNLGKEPKNKIYPLDKVWAHHGAWDDKGYVYRAYDIALRKRYGKPISAKDYIRKAQFINAGSYRAMYEAANSRMWNITTGIMLWKLNSTWPTVVWQLYDWFLNPTSAYYFAKKALEPLHIQLNENDFTVSVINNTYKKYKDLKANVRVFDFNLKTKWEKEINISIDKNKYSELFKLPKVNDLTEVYFVKLQLKDNKGKILSDNFYWLSSKEKKDIKDFSKYEKVGSDSLFWFTKHDEVDFSKLTKLPKVNLDVNYHINETNWEYRINVKVKNNKNKLAFFNRLIVKKGINGEEVLPSFWSDNFFTLLPGEEKSFTVSVAKSDVGKTKPIVEIEDNN